MTLRLELHLRPRSTVETRAMLVFRDGGIAVNELHGNVSPELAEFLEAEMVRVGIEVKREGLVETRPESKGEPF